MSAFTRALENLRASPQRWLVTGCAGFIGSHLVETLLANGQHVVGLDNFSTGSRVNVSEFSTSSIYRNNFQFIEGDIRDLSTCRNAMSGVDFVLHQAALVSVPASLDHPALCNAINVDGFLNVLIAAREAGAKHVVYASSCAVYGDSTEIPIREETPARPISPYGTSKLVDELYADLFARTFGLHTTGLRYFNVFGPRQDPAGGYAAVIPKWIASLLRGEACTIHGDGTNTRDFCHVANIVQANILAATSAHTANMFNVGLGARTSLNELYALIRSAVSKTKPEIASQAPVYEAPRAGDILHSQAKISKIRATIGFEPAVTVAKGIAETVEWFAKKIGANESSVA